jgi:hypothetical protein
VVIECQSVFEVKHGSASALLPCLVQSKPHAAWRTGPDELFFERIRAVEPVVRPIEEVLTEYTQASIPFVEEVGHGRAELQLFRHLVRLVIRECGYRGALQLHKRGSVVKRKAPPMLEEAMAAAQSA